MVKFAVGFWWNWDPAGLVWHGQRPKAGNGKIEMENGPKQKNGKKNGQKIMENSLKNPFLGHFFAIFLPLSSLGPFSISISIFLPFPAFGRFPCHTSPAGSQWWNMLLTIFPAKEARKSPSKLRRKFATNFAENFANFTLEITGA